MSIPSPQAGLPATGTVKAPLALEASPAQYLTFQLGGEMFAVGILNIKEIIEYGSVTEIPMVPPFIRGVINLRGAVVPVIDLALCFGQSATDVRRRTCIVIVDAPLPGQNRDIGVLVDEVHAVIDVAEDAIEPAPLLGRHVPADFIAGMARREQGFTVLLRVERALSLDDMHSLFAGLDPANHEQGETHEPVDFL